jgi:hypothetical protein
MIKQFSLIAKVTRKSSKIRPGINNPTLFLLMASYFDFEIIIEEVSSST